MSEARPSQEKKVEKAWISVIGNDGKPNAPFEVEKIGLEIEEATGRPVLRYKGPQTGDVFKATYYNHDGKDGWYADAMD